MISAETYITNLLHQYAEHMDLGNFAAAAAMFDHAELILDPEHDIRTDSDGILNIWEQMVIVYDDGTPRTRHLVSNPIIDIDTRAGLANCRSAYTVYQQVGDRPLETILCGRYHDTFERIDGDTSNGTGGVWRFLIRDYSLMDLVGDMSRHLRTQDT